MTLPTQDPDHPPAGDAAPAADHRPRGGPLALLSLVALGVVYGDIGTSPLYSMRECFHGRFGVEPSSHNILGVVSLIFWALTIVVTVKYLYFILRADNHGEGGVLALTALVARPSEGRWSRRWALVGLGLFGAALLYGDGMITPAISVLSAVEGIRIVTPVLDPYVVPLTVFILIGLFLLQHRGTAGVGRLFGPVMLLWFVVIALLGIRAVASEPHVLYAANPWYGLEFFAHNRWHGFLVLGAVFLSLTGAEALYADLGHFGPRPIRVAWGIIVMPSLLCNYFGQAASLLRHPEQGYHPFFGLSPGWFLIPLVVLATAATIIASQAMISGAYSLTRQAIQLGYLPRLRVIHTSETHIGQIYMPQVNWILLVSTVLLVVGFRSSSGLAAAYGMAVTTTMLVTTLLFYAVARTRWRWGRLRAGIPAVLFLVVDLSFFTANLGKILHGALLPLVIGAAGFVLLTTWKRGRELLYQKVFAGSPALAEFVTQVASHPPTRVPGYAVFMAGKTDITPPALLHNLKHNRVLHDHVAVLTVVTEDTPRVARESRVEVEDMGQGFYRVFARFGFMEEPHVPQVLELAREKGLDFPLPRVSFFLGRERLLAYRRPLMASWRQKLFAAMSRNSEGATAYFHIPPNQVVELGAQIQI